MMPPISLAVSLAISVAFAPVAHAAGAAAVPPAGDSGLAWPTDAGRCVTSSFCEFRPGHFHSGLDISTWGRTGYRCFAVDDGEIVRARVACGGYGRAVYVRLKDGRTAVYAHLSRFAGGLADSMRARQEAEGSSWVDVDFAPGTFPVRRGGLVAYTGQSGVGVPHLHVEIRDAEQRPLDPLRAGLSVADSTPPRVTRVALTPLGPASSVDGRSDTVIYDVLPGNPAPPDRLARTLPAEGEIGISLEFDETTDICRYHLAPARIELREGGKLLYAIDYASFDFAETGLMDLQIDPRFSYGKVGRFHHLWRRPGNDLSFGSGEGPSGGVIRSGRIPPDERRRRGPVGAASLPSEMPWRASIQGDGERTRRLTCVVVDAAGNRSAVEIALSFAAPPSVAVLHGERIFGSRSALDSVSTDLSRAWVDTLVVDGALRAPGRPVKEVRLDLSWDGGRTWIAQPPALPDPDLSFHTRIPLRRLVPGAGERSAVLRAQAIDTLGGRGIPMAHGLGEAPPESEGFPDFEIVAVGAWMEVRFPETVPFGAISGGWETWLAAEEGAADSVSAVLVRPWGSGVRIVTEAGPGGRREWAGDGPEWKGFDPWGRPRPLRFELPPRVEAGRPGRALSSDGRADIRFPGDVFRESAVPLVRREPPPASVHGGELRCIGSLYVLETGHVPLAGSYELRLEAPGVADYDPARVAVFVQENGRFRYLGGERVSDGASQPLSSGPGTDSRVWTADMRTLLPVGLFEDVTAPTLGDPRLEERFGRASLLFLAKDEGAGLGCDAVEVFLDGTPILVELDDETGDVVAYPPLPLEPGQGGVFEIRASDRCGNTTRRTDEVRFP